MSKIWGKFETNWDHYLSERNKLIYTKNWVGEIALQYLKPCFRLKSTTSFTIINDLFNYLKDIFDDSYRIKYVIENFWELKMGASFFSDFYTEFIRLTSDLEYISEILIWQFIQKLISQLQDSLDSGIKLPNTVSILAKWYLNIYEQIQITDWISDLIYYLHLLVDT